MAKVDGVLRPFRGRQDEFDEFWKKFHVVARIQKWEDAEARMNHLPLYLSGDAFSVWSEMIGRTPWICFSSITGYARTAQRKSVRWEPCMAGNRMCWLRVGRKCSRRVFGWIVWSAERPRFVITWRSNCPRWIGSRTATSARTLKATLFYCASPSVDKRGRLRTKLAGWWAASSRRLL